MVPLRGGEGVPSLTKVGEMFPRLIKTKDNIAIVLVEINIYLNLFIIYQGVPVNFGYHVV